MPTSFKTALSHTLRPPPLVRLELVLTVAPGEPGYEQFRAHLHAFLRHSGIAAALAGERLVLIGAPGPLQPGDKALVMHWLIRQPQVLMIAMRRPERERQRRERQEDRRHG